LSLRPQKSDTPAVSQKAAHRVELTEIDCQNIHGGAREISAAGTKDLLLGMESITGYNIINAESLEKAE
jgi:hypothetical protein